MSGYNLWTRPRRRGEDPKLDARLDTLAARMKAEREVLVAARGVRDAEPSVRYEALIRLSQALDDLDAASSAEKACA